MDEQKIIGIAGNIGAGKTPLVEFLTARGRHPERATASRKDLLKQDNWLSFLYFSAKQIPLFACGSIGMTDD